MYLCLLQEQGYGPNVAAAPVSYIISYFGKNITNGSVTVNVSTGTIDLPAVASDVNVFVTAMSVFGTGPVSNVTMDKISELYINLYIQEQLKNCEFKKGSRDRPLL